MTVAQDTSKPSARQRLLKLALRCEREEPSEDLDYLIGHTFPFQVGVVRLRPYTSSLDAAVMLIPKEHQFSLTDWSSNEEEKPPRARVFPAITGGSEYDWRHGDTPALALCAAALRARAQEAR